MAAGYGAIVILTSTTLDAATFERATGWELKPEGACKGELCVPLRDAASDDGDLDVEVVAERLGMGLVHDADADLWALGPETVGGHALTSAAAPDLTLPDRHGEPVALAELRGRKVLLVAWASW